MFFLGVLFIILSIIILLLAVCEKYKVLVVVAIILVFICSHISLLYSLDNTDQLNSVNKKVTNIAMGYFPIPQLDTLGYTITSVKFNSKYLENPTTEVHYKSIDNELEILISSKDEIENIGKNLNLNGFKEIYLISENVNNNKSYYTFNGTDFDDKNYLYIFISDKNDKMHILDILKNFHND